MWQKYGSTIRRDCSSYNHDLAVAFWPVFHYSLSMAEAYISKGLLRPCEKKHRGVSSNPASQKSKTITPLIFSKGMYAPGVKDHLRKIVQKHFPSSLKKNGESYLHFEIKKGLLGNIDDLEILLVAEKHEVHFRSVARKWWDFGRNRKRVETIKKIFEQGQKQS